MNPKLLGFLRGVGYVIVFSVLSYIVDHVDVLVSLGWISQAGAVALTGIIAVIEHAYTQPATA